MRINKIKRVIRLIVSLLYLLFPLGYYVYMTYTGRPIDTSIFILLIAFVFASGYVIYSEKIMDKATEAAQDVTGKGDEGGDENGKSNN